MANPLGDEKQSSYMFGWEVGHRAGRREALLDAANVADSHACPEVANSVRALLSAPSASDAAEKTP